MGLFETGSRQASASRTSVGRGTRHGVHRRYRSRLRRSRCRPRICPTSLERPDPSVRQHHAVRREGPLAPLASMHERRVRSTGGVRPRRTGVTMHDHVDRLRADRRSAVDGPGELATKRQHERGKLTARERLDLLLDSGTFFELDLFVRHRSVALGLADHRPATDGVVTDGAASTTVWCSCSPMTSASSADRWVRCSPPRSSRSWTWLASVGAPLIGLNDGAGAGIQEGVAALAGYAGIFRRSVRSSGVIPQISVILGPCADGAAYSPALTDFVGMVLGTSQMFLTGPEVIAAVTSESVTAEVLGGADAHGARSGVASFVAEDETECLETVRHLVRSFPPTTWNRRHTTRLTTVRTGAVTSCSTLFRHRRGRAMTSTE